MKKLDILRNLSFGSRIAEDEADSLAKYFLETDQFREIKNDRTDIVYGQKGAGKSALYVALKNDEYALLDKNVILVAGENPRGTPAFKDLVYNPPTGESEFIALWKLYFLSLIGSSFVSLRLENDDSEILLEKLKEVSLIPQTLTLSSIIRTALDYARQLIRWDSLSATVELDPLHGTPKGFTGKITLREPSAKHAALGFVSLETLFERANLALQKSGCKIWICLDRLDVAFAETPELESNALRALFKVYLDILSKDNIRLKIFLRSDIWTRITQDGFRESSHITRGTFLSWSHNDLLNLVMRRVVQSEILCDFYNVKKEEVLASFSSQESLFYKIFPDRVYAGTNKSKTFDWLISRTSDGTGFSAPRELLHLLARAREVQIKKLEQGHQDPSDTWLFDRQSMREALEEVSKVRLEQTIYPEYPQLKPAIVAIQGEKAEQSLETLAAVWNIELEEARTRSTTLADIGIFTSIGTKNSPRYKVPFLYRSHLRITQGQADAPHPTTAREEDEDGD